MHTNPTESEPQYVARPVIDLLFPPGVSARIPILSVTGTNGKTTTVRMIAHILKLMGRRVGMTSTDGVVVDAAKFETYTEELERKVRDAELRDTKLSRRAELFLISGSTVELSVPYKVLLRRPNFGSLNPAITLNPSNNPLVQSTGNAGNPDLRAQKSTSYDATAEYYFRSGYIAVAGYYRDITDRVITSGAVPPVSIVMVSPTAVCRTYCSDVASATTGIEPSGNSRRRSSHGFARSTSVSALDAAKVKRPLSMNPGSGATIVGLVGR